MKKKISIVLLVVIILLLVGGGSVTGAYVIEGKNRILQETNHQINSPLYSNIDRMLFDILVKVRGCVFNEKEKQGG